MKPNEKIARAIARSTAEYGETAYLVPADMLEHAALLCGLEQLAWQITAHSDGSTVAESGRDAVRGVDAWRVELAPAPPESAPRPSSPCGPFASDS